MLGYLLYLSIGALLWLLIATGWGILLVETSHIWLVGEISLWLIFLCISCLLPLAIWWTEASPLRCITLVDSPRLIPSPGAEPAPPANKSPALCRLPWRQGSREAHRRPS